jgi:Gas vesicle synthesis protein GvpL/GvpF
MTLSETAEQGSQQPDGSQQQRGWYVYGVLPADVELTSDVAGVGNPPGKVQLVRSGELAALVSQVDLTAPLGSPEDLTAHEEILDASASDVPVLPLRFGAVLASEEAVAQDLLDANHDAFTAALGELENRVQYVVKGRYVEAAILSEILAENREAAQLRDQIQGADPDATRDARIRLGEIVNEAVSAHRAEDTRTVADAMAGHCVALTVRDPSHELDAAHIALLIETGQEDDVEGVLGNLATDWQGRVEFRLLGPMAAYDFVGTAEPEG